MFQESIWGIDLGGASVRVVRLERRSSGHGHVAYEVTAVDRVELYQDPKTSRPDEMDAALRRALGLFVTNHRIGSRDRVGVAIPSLGFEAFTIEVPPMAPARTKELINYELHKRTHAAGNELVFGYRETPAPSAHERRFLAIAGPAGILGAYSDALRTAGIDVDCLTIAPIATLDAFAADHTDLRDTICIHIGVGLTEIAFATREGLQMRAEPDGTAWLSREMCVRFGFSEQEADAERRLLESGTVAPRFVNIVKEFSAKIVKNVAAALEYTNKRGRGSAFRRILLVGEGSRVPSLAEELKLQLGMVVDIHTKWNRIAIHKRLMGHAIATEVPSFTSAIGAALGAVPGSPTVSFVTPPAVRETLRLAPMLMMSTAVLALSVGASYGMLQFAKSRTAGAIVEARGTTETLQKQMEAATEVERVAARGEIAAQAWSLPREWLAWEKLCTSLLEGLGQDAVVHKLESRILQNGDLQADVQFTIPRLVVDGAVESRPRSFQTDVAVMLGARSLPEPTLLEQHPVVQEGDAPPRFDYFKIRVVFPVCLSNDHDRREPGERK